ncbi:ribonuclease HI [Propioniferax innocua]|uniref:Ribonuclease H n=1 Tax=Propioniferax innocua TaxID=1753 RepID=A0A542ZSV8_9ACTN|nr:ribonuclease HI [Propioniferax innocua]
MDENLQFVLASAALHDTIARVITAAADGSALNNPGPAGWAWFIDDTCWAAGGWPSSTNNRGELQAVLDLLHQTAHVDDELTVLCDSQYVINVITKWMSGWKRKGWKKADGRPVLNVDLVQALDEAMLGRNVTFEWVRGHSGHELNEAADKLARAAAEAFRDGTKVKSGPGFPGAGTAPLTTDQELLTEPDDEPELGLPRDGFDGDLFSEVDDADVPKPSDEDIVAAAERSLLTDAVRQDPAQVATLLHAQWTEIGASGRQWTRAEMLAEIGPLPPVDGRPLADTFEVIDTQRLTPDAILLLWRTAGSIRSSVWLRHQDGWLQRFTQGTPQVD